MNSLYISQEKNIKNKFKQKLSDDDKKFREFEFGSK